MERKTRFYIIAVLLLLIFIGGTILGFKVAGAGRPRAAPGSSLDTMHLKELERGLEEGSGRSLERIEGAIGAAGSIEERERSVAEGLGLAADHARNLEGGIGRIGEDTDEIGGGLEEIGGIVEELRKRAEGKVY